MISDHGKVIYKNPSFDKTVSKEKRLKFQTLFPPQIITQPSEIECNSTLFPLGQRLYKIRLTTVKTIPQSKTYLNIFRLFRVTNKDLKTNRKLDKAGLSSRELEITALINQGVSTHDISDQLNISYHTVRNHIKHIYHKMGVSTRSKMMTWGE